MIAMRVVGKPAAPGLILLASGEYLARRVLATGKGILLRGKPGAGLWCDYGVTFTGVTFTVAADAIELLFAPSLVSVSGF